MQVDTKEQTVLDMQQSGAAQLPAHVQPSAVAPIAQPATAMDLLSMVTQRGASIEEISKFMDLMERQEAKVARQAYVRAMAAFKKNPPDIYKNKGVEHSGISYMHATLGNICEQIISALAEHGISHAWDIDQQSSGLIRVTCTLTHEQGHSESTSMDAPADNSGKKNPIQSIASSITYLERYTLLAACGIAVKEQGDDDGRGAGGAQLEQPKQKQTLSIKAFGKALDAIKGKTYTLAEIEEEYILTPEQRIEALAAEKE